MMMASVSGSARTATNHFSFDKTLLKTYINQSLIITRSNTVQTQIKKGAAIAMLLAALNVAFVPAVALAEQEEGDDGAINCYPNGNVTSYYNPQAEAYCVITFEDCDDGSTSYYGSFAGCYT